MISQLNNFKTRLGDEVKFACLMSTFKAMALVHFTIIIAGGNEAGVYIVLIQPFLLYYIPANSHTLCMPVD